MYLFSVLGVQGKPNIRIMAIGGLGAITLVIAVLIECFALVVWAGARPARSRRNLETSNSRSEKRLSLSRVGDDMTIAGLV